MQGFDPSSISIPHFEPLSLDLHPLLTTYLIVPHHISYHLLTLTPADFEVLSVDHETVANPAFSLEQRLNAALQVSGTPRPE
jgi:hypothetical protein